MPNPALKRIIRAGFALLLVLSIARPTQARQSAHTHLLIKLSTEAWIEPSRALSHYSLEQWTPLLVPGWVRVTLPPLRQTHLIAAMAEDPNVLALETDLQVQTAITPNDTGWPQQWGPQKVRAPAAWDSTTGDRSVIVAVLDTGADLGHSDLAGQFWVNPHEIPGNGLDDDGNGKIDDINGWRFSHDADDAPYESNDVNDDHGHGTHVAGIISARGNNGQGIAGMAWGCQLMLVKILDNKGNGYNSEVANGLVYATDNGARLANLSLGGPDPSQIMEDALNYANTHGTLVVAAAGNSGSAVLYPAAYPSVVAVAATDQNDQRLSFSCHGPEIDLAAPGSLIYSTCRGNRYCYKSGTSMAAPHVAGLAALLRSQYPSETTEQIRQRLRSSAQDVHSPGWDEYTGWGRIDGLNALPAVQMVPILYLPIVAVHHDLIKP